MNKFLIALAAIALSITSCQNACDVKDDINQLKNERDYVNLQLSNERTTLQALELKHGNINAKLRAIDSLALYNEQLKLGKTRYVITFEGKQSHFSLDISEHVKDEMNAFTFEIPVDVRLLTLECNDVSCLAELQMLVVERQTVDRTELCVDVAVLELECLQRCTLVGELKVDVVALVLELIDVVLDIAGVLARGDRQRNCGERNEKLVHWKSLMIIEISSTMKEIASKSSATPQPGKSLTLSLLVLVASGSFRRCSSSSSRSRDGSLRAGTNLSKNLSCQPRG
jgi:hypothetical protein